MIRPKMPANNSNDILKYSGMAFEMAAFIGVGLFIGIQIDRWLKLNQPYGTLIFGVLFLVAYFVKLIRSLSRKS